MKNKILYFFVEGNDDELFFQRVIMPKISMNYLGVITWKYSRQTKKDIQKFLASVREMHANGSAESIFVADLDELECVEKKKEILLSAYQLLSKSDRDRDWSRSWVRIVIVCKEIESWYLAGLSSSACAQIGVKSAIRTTDKISKEDFNRMIPKKYESRIDFMQEVLNSFRIELACSKNSSFEYLIQNLLDQLE